MFTSGDPETFWLTTTNVVLGLVALACFVIVARVVVKEVYARLAKRVAVSAPVDDHAFVVPLLGVTMADGGERLDKRTPVSDESNIIRSEN